MKQLFITLFLISTTVLYSQGKYELGYENLKWNMTGNQVKIVLATDTISSMRVLYRDGIITKENGKLAEHTFQRINAVVNRTDYQLTYSCIIIDNSLCLIAVYDLRNKEQKPLDYLTEKSRGLFSDESYVYPVDAQGWRTDANVMIYLGGQPRTNNFPQSVILLRKDMKTVYDNIIFKLENDRSIENEYLDIRRKPY
jgi:hypothetical protein